MNFTPIQLLEISKCLYLISIEAEEMGWPEVREFSEAILDISPLTRKFYKAILKDSNKLKANFYCTIDKHYAIQIDLQTQRLIGDFIFEYGSKYYESDPLYNSYLHTLIYLSNAYKGIFQYMSGRGYISKEEYNIQSMYLPIDRFDSKLDHDDKLDLISTEIYHLMSSSTIIRANGLNEILEELKYASPEITDNLTKKDFDNKLKKIKSWDDFTKHELESFSHYYGERLLGDLIFEQFSDLEPLEPFHDDYIALLRFLSKHHQGIYQYMYGKYYLIRSSKEVEISFEDILLDL